jgi:hypothetical protein
MDSQTAIRERIAQLPQGNLLRTTVKGDTYFYLRWRMGSGQSQQTASVVPLAALRDGMGTRVGAVHYALIFRSIALKRFFMYACDDVDTPWHLM